MAESLLVLVPDFKKRHGIISTVVQPQKWAAIMGKGELM